MKLEKLVWADQWMTYYDLEVPHHRHWTELKKQILYQDIFLLPLTTTYYP